MDDFRPRRPNAVLVVIAVPVIAALAVLVTALASGDDASTVAADAPANAITIENFEYAPGTFDAEPGVSIDVVNRDDTAHTITADDETSFDTGDLAGGDTATITVDEPGSYGYFCAIHDYMKGIIRVQG